ncbi:DMT family transporter [Pseudonocardia kujensis]|uniref:DMT family transporter n=1 Tax=Pseudonocardia kujensis TaxID=1128675 RepID=UPI001E4132E1|nr:DMT family transporter [Pseudonocardia kujensis]MCE0764163.1 DMT family transporter [Pseudonocardia kujensis]
MKVGVPCHDQAALAERSRLADGKKTRMGMIYAILAAPALGLAFGLLGSIVTSPPFDSAPPTGALVVVATMQVPFGVLAIALFLLITGTWRDTVRVLGHRVSWWNLFVAVGGFVGDLCFAAASGLIGGALAGSIGGLAGVVGAIIAALLYRERILRASTLIGLAGLGVGIWLAVSGGELSAPTHGVYFAVGLLIIVGAVLTWGFESFAISAGTDLMPPESFLWWRAFLELVIAVVLLLALFPEGRRITAEAWSEPRLVAIGSVIGLGWAIWMIMGYYIGIAYAGAVRGGVLTNTLAFFFISFFSLTVYGAPFNAFVVIGSGITIVGTLFIVTEPKGHLANLRH